MYNLFFSKINFFFFFNLLTFFLHLFHAIKIFFLNLSYPSFCKINLLLKNYKKINNILKIFQKILKIKSIQLFLFYI